MHVPAVFVASVHPEIHPVRHGRDLFRRLTSEAVLFLLEREPYLRHRLLALADIGHDQPAVLQQDRLRLLQPLQSD